jgi:hypothetical protein
VRAVPLDLGPRLDPWQRIRKNLRDNGPEYICNAIAILVAVVLLAAIQLNKAHLP